MVSHDLKSLVGGFNPSEKYVFVSWDDDIPNCFWKIKVMFQTTIQMSISLYIPQYTTIFLWLSYGFHVPPRFDMNKTTSC